MRSNLALQPTKTRHSKWRKLFVQRAAFSRLSASVRRRKSGRHLVPPWAGIKLSQFCEVKRMSDKERSSIGKIAAYVVVSIFLGAVGSGLWERCLKPAADWAIRGLLSGSTWLSRRYVDHLYSEVGYGFHEHAAARLFLGFKLAIVFFNIAGLLYAIWLRRRFVTGTESSVAPVARLSQTVGIPAVMWLLAAMCCLNILLYGENAFADSYQQGTAIWIERSFEIVRPHIPEPRFYQLRAQYRACDDAESFFKLWRSLVETAREAKVSLPVWEPIGPKSLGAGA